MTMTTNIITHFDGADLGPSVGDQRYNIGADSGPVLLSDQGHSSGASSGPGLSDDQGHNSNSKIPSRSIRLGKTNMKFATWNVRTMQQCGKPELVVTALHHYKVDVACLQEVRFPDSGSLSVLAAGTDEVYKVFHSGSENGQHGVAIAIRSQLDSAITDFNVVSDRICYVTLQAKPSSITIISAYAPTNEHDATVRQAFYDDLQRVVDSIPQGHFLVVGIDANAKLGHGLPSNKSIGPFATGSQCENGALLRDFCASQNLAVANTFFQHQLKHKVTWSSPAGKTHNEIDFVLVRCRWRSSVQNTRAYWGACSFASSDHALVCSIIHMRFRVQKQRTATTRFNTFLLKHAPTACRFKHAVVEKLSSSQDQPTIEARAGKINKALIEAGQETLMSSRRKLDQWVSEHTLELITQRSHLPRHQRKNRSKIDRAIKDSLKKDREAHWQGVAKEMEDASRAGNTRKLYQLLRKCSGKGKNVVSDSVKKADGTIASKVEEKMQCWADHFSNLLNAGSAQQPGIDAQFLSPMQELSCTTEAPTVEEISSAIKRLRNNKAAGEDNIPPEFYKVAVCELTTDLHAIFNQMWVEEKVPSQWSLSILVPVFKKGDKLLCNNYRGISLLDISLKIFESIILHRFQSLTETLLRDNQAGFRPGRGCADQIFSLRMILNKRLEFQQPTSILFVDFKAAFDSVNRGALWQISEQYGLPSKLISMLKALYNNTRCAVRVNGKDSADFSVDTGVRQGAIASTVLFNFAIDWVMRQAVASCAKSGKKVGISVGGRQITDLDYADDLALFADNAADLQFFVDQIVFFGAMVGLKINPEKSKVLTVCAPASRISIQGIDVECVTKFRYLGSLISADNSCEEDVLSRICLAQVAFNQLYTCLFSREDVSISTKMRVYLASVRSVLLYSCESWIITSSLSSLLESCEMSFLRRILGIRGIPRPTNEEVRSRCFVEEKLSQTIKRRRLIWLGHVLRMKDGRMPQQILLDRQPSNWKRPRGRPRQSWDRMVHTETRSLTNHIRNAIGHWADWSVDGQRWISYLGELASSRTQWRQLVVELARSS